MSPVKSPTRLLLIRHGETDWNIAGRWQGQADIPMNERGRQQAQDMANTLADEPVDAIYSSDLLRSRQTAAPLAEVKGLAVHYDPRLREIDQGRWQGLQLSEIQAKYADIYEQRHTDPWGAAPPGGESVNQVHARVIACVDEIVAAYPGQTVVIVSHGFALGLIIVHYQHLAVEKVWERIPNNCEPYELLVL